MIAVARKGRNPGDRYALVAIVLHWLIAALILLQIILAGRMEGRSPEAFAIVQLHKSVGVTVLLLSLLRLGWRLANPPPPMPPTMARWEKALAAATHVGFYGIMIGMPLTGWIMVSTSRFDIPTMLYGVVPWPHIPGLPELAAGPKHVWHEIGEAGHDAIIKVFYVLIALHVAGALKHQLFSRDEPVLSRMAPGARAGRWLEPRIAVIALAALAVVAFGLLVQPPLHAASVPRPGDEPPEAADPLPANVAAGATPALAAAAAPTAATAPGAPVKWVVDVGDSDLEFETSWGGQKIEGEFERWTADVVFSPDALDKSRVRVSIDMGSADTGDAQRDQSLPAADWFDAANHPRAVFEASRFERAGDDRYVAHGRLTLRGVTRPLSLPFRLQIDGDKARVRGVTSLDRTAFGVGQGDWTSTDQIPAKVSVSVDLEATRG